MESSSIELKVKSCKDVRAFNFFQKLSVYALVSIVSDDPNKKMERNQRQRTPTNRVDGDGNPEWNQKMHFDLNEVWGSDSECDHNLFFHFELRHEGMVFGDKTIGEVRVPFKDLIQDSNAATGVVRFVSYQVRTGDGKPNGVLNFSYKLIRNGKGKASKTNSTASSVNQITGYPTVDDHQQQQSQDPEIRYPPSEILEESLSFSTPQQVDRSLSSGTPSQYSSHQTNYYTPPPPPPPPDGYYPRPPPPPSDAYYLPPPPPPPMPHEACHHHHHHHPPHPHRPWAPNSFWNGR